MVSARRDTVSPQRQRDGRRSVLHRAGEEPADEEPLEPDDDQHGWQARQHGRRGDVAPRDLEDAREEGERHGNRPARLRGRERVGEEELVPAEEERQERRRGDPRGEQRDDDPAARRQDPGAVDRRGLLGLHGNLADEAGEEPDRQGQRELGVDQDEAGPRVAEGQGTHQEIERAHGGDLGERGARDDREQQHALAGHREPRDRVRGGQPEDQREDRRERRDAAGVEEGGRDEAQLEDDPVVRERETARQERRDAQQLGLRLERRQELPEERHRARGERREDQQVGDRPRRGLHAATVRARSSRRYTQATPMTRTKTTTLMAEPKPSWSIWKRLRYA